MPESASPNPCSGPRAGATAGLRRPRRPRRLAALAGAALVAIAAGACTEELETTAVCPDLCPEQQIQVEELELRPVVLDTSLSGFPLLGNEPYLALVRRGDSLDTRAAIRFDELPKYHRTSSATLDSVPTTQVIDPVIQLVLVHPVSDYDAPVLLEAFDIGHGGGDTTTAEVLPLFTAARLLGSVTVQPRAATDTATFDTLSVPLDPQGLLGRITAGERLRVGLRISGPGSASVLLTHGATLQFRAAADTLVPRVTVNPASDTPTDEPGLRADLRSYMIVAAGTPAPPPTAIAVGGLPSRRTFLRFEIPETVLDSATIVRATLVLTQRPVPGYAATDTISVRALPVTAGSVVTDIDRLTRLAANPRNNRGEEIQVVPPLEIVPGDSGQREISIANLVALWAGRSGVEIQPAIVLTAGEEGTSPLRATFFSSEAAAELRPVLRLSYIRRVNFVLP